MPPSSPRPARERTLAAPGQRFGRPILLSAGIRGAERSDRCACACLFQVRQGYSGAAESNAKPGVTWPERGETRRARSGMSGPGRRNCAPRRYRRLARRSAGPRAVRRAQPRHRAPRLFRARCRPSEFDRMRAPFMAGTFPFPVKYGYAAVGRVKRARAICSAATSSRCIRIRRAFIVPPRRWSPLPAGVPPQRAVLAANMETALNAVWDAAPGPADRIAVVGAGVRRRAGRLSVRPRFRALTSRWSTSIRRAPRLPARWASRSPPPTSAGRLRSRVPRQRAPRQGSRPRCGSPATKATVVELSWYGDAATSRCRSAALPQPAAAADRRARSAGRAVASSALDHRRRLRGGARPAGRSACSTRCSRPRLPSTTCRRGCRDILAPGGGVLCQVVCYPDYA